ncbi:haloacid dehalogenase type II [Ideonella livida]|uniref:(S)-2-haloacid dehalogenase n=1 Tax=Ideonella livida TaxID=2707176 RepID=A0A7C9PGG4_9BURK|nr:haloacid dehalogenase type II [Ideonella livida]NDY91049.1 haloacid dehalogenase type II [Ideonella livida]
MEKRHAPARVPAAAPKAVLFDAFGTLFDVYSVALTAEQLFPGHGQALASQWRTRQIDYTRLVSMSAPDGARYRPFWELTLAALRTSAAALGLALTPSTELRLMNEYRHLSAFPENREVLAALKARGIRAGILSNGDPDMLAVATKSAGFAELLDPVLSVHAVRQFKTHPAAYQLGPDALGLPARDILFVSSNGWDAIGATWFGYTTLWVNRSGAPLEQLGTEPHRIGTSLRAVLDFFPAAA